ncbi:MAG: ATP-grasp domain-containing protein, partial [Candidatus Saccharimonadales bacterium]
LAAIAERIGIDYFAIDCGEAPDGRLLVFEADVAMIVHAMDPPALFPYKGPAMRRLFDAFAALLRRLASH